MPRVLVAPNGGGPGRHGDGGGGGGGPGGRLLVESPLLTGQIWTWLGGIRIVVFLFQEFIQVLKYMDLEIVQTVICWRKMLKCMSFDPEEKKKSEEVRQKIDLMTL